MASTLPVWGCLELLRPEVLTNLGEWLGRNGFATTPALLLEARRLVEALVVDGAAVQDPAALAGYLGPLFCRDADQQGRFPAAFEAWLRTQAWSRPEIPRLREKRDPPPRSFGWRPCISLLLLVVMALCGLAWDSFRERSMVVRVIADCKLMSGATVSSTTVSTDMVSDADGVKGVPYRRWDLPVELTASMQGFVAGGVSVANVPNGEVRLLLNEMPVRAPPPPVEAPNDVTRLSGIEPPPPIESAGQPPPPPKLHPERLALLAVPFLLLAVWFVLMGLRRRGWLDRLRNAEVDQVRNIGGTQPSAVRALDGALHMLSRELRRRRKLDTGEFDAEASIQATMRTGGWPKFVFRSWVEPEYLVLIDRASIQDHQARLAEDLVRTLTERGVSLAQYFFRGDPGVLWRFGGGRAKGGSTQFERLAALAAPFGDRRLLVFSDGRELIDLYTGEVTAATRQIASWRDVILITPQDHRLWARREWALARCGITVLPLSALGVRVLGAVLGRDGNALPLPDDASQRRRAIYLQNDERLLSHWAPSPEFIAEVIGALRRNLRPDGLAWLAGCAVFPDVRWPLTLRIGAALIGTDERLSQVVPTLVATPWLRESYFPDWMREALRAELTPEQERTVRDLLVTFQDRESADSVRVALARRGWKVFWRDVLAGLKLKKPRYPRDYERDLVFLRFMAGTPSKLSVEATENVVRKFLSRAQQTLRGLLFQGGTPLAPARWPLPSLVATAAALACFLALPPWPPGPQNLPSGKVMPFVTAVAVSDDGKSILTGDDYGGVRVYPVGGISAASSSRERSAVLDRVRGLHYADNARVAVVRDGGGEAFRRVDGVAALSVQPESPEVVGLTGTGPRAGGSWFDANTTIAPPPGEALCRGYDAARNRWVVVSRSVAAQFAGASDAAAGGLSATTCAVSPGAARIAVARADLSLVLVDPRQSQRTVLALPTGGSINGLALTDDAETIVAARSDGDVLVLRAGGRTEDLISGVKASGPIGLSPDGQTLAFAAEDQQTEVWSLDRKVVSRSVFVGIGIDESAAGRRGSPRADADKLAEVLKTRYGYEPLLAQDTTRAGILGLLANAAQQVRSEDRVILFVAGAGGVVPSARDVQVFTPPGAAGTKQRPGDAIKASEIAEWAARLPAREVLTILDTASAAVAFDLPKRRDDARAKTRMLLAATGEGQESVDAEGISPFGRVVYNALATTRAKGLRGQRLAEVLAYRGLEKIALPSPRDYGGVRIMPTPKFGPWQAAGHTAGDFLLIPRGPIMRPVDDETPARQPTATVVQPQREDSVGAGKDPTPPDLSVFRDCPTCPEMVVIPAGTFNMGAPESEKDSSHDERPVHAVTIRRFALGKYEVTPDEWEACVADGDCTKARDEGYGRGGRPKTDVSWEDAKRYVKWLSRRTGQTYRLPSEAEWEYAARGGTTTMWHWGEDPSEACRYENVHDETSKRENKFSWEAFPCDDGYATTAPVGTFRPNPYGLHDISGNVIEWTEDCLNYSYVGAPKDGGAWTKGECSRRVTRGGNWSVEPRTTRSAMRGSSEPSVRYDYMGFRVARTLP